MLTTEVALTLLNIPYIWGGKNPMAGFDCSGAVQWVMSSVGFDLFHGPINAQGLYTFFSHVGAPSDPKEGALIFFGQGSAIDHVGLMIDGARMFEAFNGNQYCTTRQIAQNRGACTRISPIHIRQDKLFVVMPDYSTVGL